MALRHGRNGGEVRRNEAGETTKLLGKRLVWRGRCYVNLGSEEVYLWL
jgi:hypothetical protein